MRSVTHPSRWVRRVVVGGPSMRPTLQPGDRLLVVRRRRYRPGDIVAVVDPRDPARTVVKRVAAVHDRGAAYSVLGDDLGASTDSRVFGPVPAGAVVGRAVYRYWPDARRGMLRP